METLPLAKGPQPGDVAASRNDDIIYFDVLLQVLPCKRRRRNTDNQKEEKPSFEDCSPSSTLFCQTNNLGYSKDTRPPT